MEMQVFADDSDPMTFPRPGSRYNIPVDKNRSPKVGGFQGKVPNSVAAVTLKAMDLPEIRKVVTSRGWGDGAEEIENNEDMEKFYKPS